MNNGDYNRLTAQLGVLRQVAGEYQHKTIDNIIAQMEARVKTYNN